MKICGVLAAYKRSDLNRLAKDKIANYVGLPVDILRDELSANCTPKFEPPVVLVFS